MKAYFQMFSALVIVVALFSACGPAPNPKLQAKPAEAPTDSAVPVPEKQEAVPAPVAPPVVEAEAVVKPKRQTPAKTIPARQVSAPNPVSVAAKPAPAADDTNLAAPRTLNLPAPVVPPIAEPRPPVDVIQPESVEPVLRRIRVPSGTILAVRMIDPVDSETGRVGETFKASLDAPVVLNNEIVFPEGSEVYVKLSKVQSAGRVSGRSELQLELDRIFLEAESYLLESSKYVSTGESQAGRTAKSAGLGAAIGAAIGAISGGGKGAVIGGATGAGAGAGVEAIRKGEQVRVDAETRLEFRLEEAVEVILQFPPSTHPQRNHPSGPLRFGTRQ